MVTKEEFARVNYLTRARFGFGASAYWPFISLASRSVTSPPNWILMSSEVVVRSSKNDCAIDFEQRLPNLVNFFNVAIVHGSDTLLRSRECGRKHRILHQPSATVFISFVRYRRASRMLAGQLKRKRCLVPRRASPAMETVTATQVPRTTHVEVATVLSEKIDARTWHIARERAKSNWLHRKQTLQFRRQCLDQGSKLRIHHQRNSSLKILSLAASAGRRIHWRKTYLVRTVEHARGLKIVVHLYLGRRVRAQLRRECRVIPSDSCLLPLALWASRCKSWWKTDGTRLPDQMLRPALADQS